jgi:copper homeostasis protein CutC
MSGPILEVIALSAADAVAAERGGADRLEVVRAIGIGGLTPSPEEFARIRAATRLPLRVMLRTNGGFGIDAPELDGLCREAEALRRAGAEAFVLGFLTPGGALDRAALDPLLAAIAPHPWTFHHAFDAAAEPRRTWDELQDMAGLDLVLSGGLRGDLTAGLDTLRARAGWQTARVRWLAGGGLQVEAIPRLLVAGITQFHAGRAARVDGRWDRPLDPAAVRRLRRAVRGEAGAE